MEPFVPGRSTRVDLKLVSRLEFGSGAVAMRYEPRRSLSAAAADRDRRREHYEQDHTCCYTSPRSLASGARQHSKVRAREVVDEVRNRFLFAEIRVQSAALEPPVR